MVIDMKKNVLGFPQKRDADNWHEWLKQWASRYKHCPVRAISVKEYAVPINYIYRDESSQARDDQHCDPNHSAELAGGFVVKGQTLGICIRPPKGKELLFPLAWGNHRLDAAESLNRKNIAIDKLDTGYIWASIYKELPSELTFYQTLENNLHEVAKPADEKANLFSLKKLVKQGYLDSGYNTKFKDADEKEQDRRLHDLMKRCMPGAKKKTLVTKWRKEKDQPFKIWSYSTTNAKKHFARYYGSQTGFNPNDSAGSSQVFEMNGKKVIMVPAIEGQGGGKYMETAHQTRNVNKVCEEVWFVAALPKATLRSGAIYDTPRKQWIQSIEKWNDSVKAGKVVDRIMFVAQNENEKQQNKAWILDHRF